MNYLIAYLLPLYLSNVKEVASVVENAIFCLQFPLWPNFAILT